MRFYRNDFFVFAIFDILFGEEIKHFKSNICVLGSSSLGFVSACAQPPLC